MNLQKHMANVHKKGEGDKQCKCDFKDCKKSFEYPKNLANHISIYHSNEGQVPPQEDGLLKCTECEETFRVKSSLHYHQQRHVKPSFECSVCPRTFKSGRGLKYHMNIHNNIAEYLCDDCGRAFVTRQKLINHRRAKHTFERPYICDVCGEGFTRSDWLVVHKRRAHTGEKPYACDKCEWKGVDSSSLIHHKKRHKPKDDATSKKKEQQTGD
jgi:KRAB domain-containing zinc finger protein